MKYTKNPKVDKYLVDGCMRCKLGATPACKVNKWVEVLETLRWIMLDSGLSEDLKWGVPCYTLNQKNVIMISAFKEYACISFLKGALLQDKHQRDILIYYQSMALINLQDIPVFHYYLCGLSIQYLY